MSILFVEDEEPLIELLRSMFGPDRKIRLARTMKEAREEIAAEAPRHIVLDLGLPDSPPSMTMQRIRELKKSARDAVIIVITGYPHHAAAAREAGADRFINKGGNVRALFEELDAALVDRKGHVPESPVVRAVEETVRSIVRPSDCGEK